MSPSPLSAIAGPVALIAGALVALTRIATILTIPAEPAALRAAVVAPAHAINGVASIVAFSLLLLALVAIYEREATAAGWLGVIGLGAAMTGTVFMAGDWWYEAFAVPWMADVAPAVFETGPGGRLLVGGLSSFAMFAVGWVIFGAASLRAHVFPAAISGAILIGPLVRRPSWCLPGWRHRPRSGHRIARRVAAQAGPDPRGRWTARAVNARRAMSVGSPPTKRGQSVRHAGRLDR
jgi:hypothetical protein